MGFSSIDYFMSSALPFFGIIIFILVGGTFAFIIINGLKEWKNNNNSPKLTVAAEIATKRSKTSGGSGDTSASTSYYVTFQVESGDRMEFRMKGTEYGMLAEGDIGMLTFQGSRYLEFKRGH